MAETKRVGALLRTVIGVTIVSMLIWVFAESESLSSERISVRLSLPSGEDGGDLIIEPSNAWTGSILVELEGSRGSLSRAEAAFASQVELIPGSMGGLVPSEPGSHELDLSRVVGSLPGVEGAGLRVVRVQPERAQVRVIRLTSRELPVVTRLPIGFTGTGTPAPETVSVRMPESAARSLGPEAVVYAQVEREAVRGLLPGRAATISDVAIELPTRLLLEPYVRTGRRQVDVTVRVEAQTDQVTLNSVPVWIKRPAFNADRVLLSLPVEDLTVPSVEVSGPSGLIASIREGALRVVAIAEVPAELLGDLQEPRTLPVTLTFEDFDSPLEFEASKRTVSLTARPVGQTPEPGAEPGEALGAEDDLGGGSGGG